VCSGHDLVLKRERENGVFTGVLRATELGWKHSVRIKGMRRVERTIFTIFTITLVLERGSYLVVLKGRVLVGGGSMWWGFLSCGHVRSCDYGRLVSIYYPAFLPCS